MSIHEFKMNTMGVQFRNEQFLSWSRPHKGLRWGIRLYAAAGNPRRTPSRAKRAIYGWILTNPTKIYNAWWNNIDELICLSANSAKWRWCVKNITWVFCDISASALRVGVLTSNRCLTNWIFKLFLLQLASKKNQFEINVFPNTSPKSGKTVCIKNLLLGK